MSIFEQMAAAEREGFAVLVIGGHAVNAYGYTRTMLDVDRQLLDFGGTLLPVPKPLNLIALKLHAMRNPERFKKGKDLPDILYLISICQIDPQSGEFLDVLSRYASDETRSLLASHLR